MTVRSSLKPLLLPGPENEPEYKQPCNYGLMRPFQVRSERGADDGDEQRPD